MALAPAAFYAVRRAQNRKPATYTCPLCNRFLPALSEHVLIAPEGDPSRRRHAHTACALKARAAGRLPDRDEYLRAQRAAAPPGPLRRLVDRLGHRTRS